MARLRSCVDCHAEENLCFTWIDRLNYCSASFCRLLSPCSQSPAEGTSAVEMIVKETRHTHVRLTQEEMATLTLTVVPVIRGEFRRFRDFQGIVGANEHALAEITPVVRGRAVAVYADVGQEVKTGQLLNCRIPIDC